MSALSPELASVHVLARLQLAARRNGLGVRLRNASAELLDLVAFLGLTEALPTSNMGDQEVKGCQ